MDAIVNGIVFLISFSLTAFLVYRNATEFCVFICMLLHCWMWLFQESFGGFLALVSTGSYRLWIKIFNFIVSYTYSFISSPCLIAWANAFYALCWTAELWTDILAGKLLIKWDAEKHAVKLIQISEIKCPDKILFFKKLQRCWVSWYTLLSQRSWGWSKRIPASLRPGVTK